MISIDSIYEGIVIDHIQAGKGMEIYRYLDLGKLDCPVALIKNVKSERYGKKDIIKIEGSINIDLDLLGYVDPKITVNIVKNDEITEKISLKLPEKITGVIKCKNPRCITSTETGIKHVFKLTESGRYRCVYCQQEDR